MLCEPLESRCHLSITLFFSTLLVDGTEGAETMSVTQNGGFVTASDGSTTRQFYEWEVSWAIVNGWGGADSITIGDGLTTTKSLWVSGGEGNDTIQGGGGQSPQLAGDGGDDTITGSTANDVLHTDRNDLIN